VTEDGEGCQWAVPGGSYFVQHNVDSLSYADGSGNASLQGVGFTGDWDKCKKQKKQQYHATKILADSAESAMATVFGLDSGHPLHVYRTHRCTS
jgi:hypothetical protein